MKITKLIWGLVLTVMFLVILPTSVFAGDTKIPQKSNEFYIYDGANILDSETKQKVIAQNEKWESEFGKDSPQVVVMTMDSIEDYPIETYKVKVFEEWKIGSSTIDNGLLILYVKDTNEIAVEVGYGLEGSLPDGKTGALLDKSLADIKGDNKSKGLSNLFTDISTIVNIDNEENLAPSTEKSETSDESESKTVIVWTVVVIGGAIVIGFIIMAFDFELGVMYFDILFRIILIFAQAASSSSSSSSKGGGGRSGGGGAKR